MMVAHLTPYTDGQWQVQGGRAQTEEQGVGRTVTVDVIPPGTGPGLGRAQWRTVAWCSQSQ